MNKNQFRKLYRVFSGFASALVLSSLIVLLLFAGAQGAYFKMLCDGLDQTGGTASSPHFNLLVSAGGQSSAIGTGTSAHFTVKAGFVYSGFVLHGDADGTGVINISDVVYLVAYIFAGGSAPCPYAIQSGDVNCDNMVNVSDAVYLVAYIFAGGPAPCAGC